MCQTEVRDLLGEKKEKKKAYELLFPMSRVGRGLAGCCASWFGVISIGALLNVRKDCVV